MLLFSDRTSVMGKKKGNLYMVSGCTLHTSSLHLPDLNNHINKYMIFAGTSHLFSHTDGFDYFDRLRYANDTN